MPYFAIEGVDGCGSTLITQTLAHHLGQCGVQCQCVAEPTSGSIGNFIRSILSGRERVSMVAMPYLFLADRLCLYEEVREHLSAGQMVISDRCYWSTLVYQQDVFSIEYLDSIHESQYLLRPTCIFVLTVDPRVAEGRMMCRSKTVEIYDNREVAKRMGLRYEKLPKVSRIAAGDHFIYIDGNDRPENVVRNIMVWARRIMTFGVPKGQVLRLNNATLEFISAKMSA